MKSFVQKTREFIRAHKLISGVIAVVIVGGGYMAFHTKSSTAAATYTVGTVEKGTIVASVSGSGQVAATSSVDLKAQSSGQIIYVGVKPGQTVRRGQTLFSLDARDAEKAVRNAKTDLETAQLDLEKFTQAPKGVDVDSLNQDIADAEKTKTDADKAIATAYRNLLNSSTVATATSTTNADTPPTVSGTYTKDIAATISIQMYPSGNNGYFVATSIPTGIVSSTGTISTSVPQPIGDTGLYIKFASSNGNQPTWIITLPNQAAASYAANEKAYQDALDAKTVTVTKADLTIAQTKQKIADLYQPDALDLRAKQIAVEQKQDALTNAQSDLSNYYIVAPFDGTIASVTANVGDTASGTLGTIITKQKIATLSLNEVDIAKIKLGQKATLTFDAVPDLTITGNVAEIDTVGTVTQGVVNYTVKIAFDTDSDMVKPGMSVSASIITDSKSDVLMVPTSAVKTNASGSYVEKFAMPLDTTAGTSGLSATTTPQKIIVETGLSDDTSTEIVSGLAEGDQIVTKTSTATAVKTTTAPSLIGGGARGATSIGGARGFGG